MTGPTEPNQRRQRRGDHEQDARYPDDEPNEPNEYGFAGGATGPEVREERVADAAAEHDARLHAEAEAIAIPTGDLTEGIREAISREEER